jgi:cytochrome c-type biogenesis protein CcmH/NrfF
MKLNILILILAVLLVCSWAQEEPTKLTFFIEHEEEQEEDYIEVSLKIKCQSRSLVDAISSAAKITSEVNSLAADYCKEYTKKGKGDCKQAVDVLLWPRRSANTRSNPSTR